MSPSPEQFGRFAPRAPVRRVEGVATKPFAETPQAEEPEASPELKKYREEAQALLDSHKNFFTSFAKDVSLSFKLGSAFFIDLEKGEVNLDTKWFSEKGFTRDQILWAVLHELSHFRDLAEDPERMMANFEDTRRRAKETGAIMMRKWEQKYGGSDPDFVDSLKRQRPTGPKDPNKTMNAVEGAAYKIHHTFWNVFDDVFVNASVARRAPAYGRGTSGGSEVERLYREKLFAGGDYRKLPRHLQFLYALLREEMVPDEQVGTTEEVVAALQKKIVFQGKNLTAREIVQEFVKPGKKKDVRAGQRHFALRRTLEPIFSELLMKDLNDWDPEKPPKPEKGEGGKGEGAPGDPNPFKPAYDEFEKNSPDQMGEDQVEAWADKQQVDKKETERKEAKAKAEEKKTPEQKAADAQKAMDAAWCAKNGVSPSALEHFRRVEAEVAPYLKDLSELWKNIIYGSGRESERQVEGHFKTGTELDVQQVVNEWPNIERGEMENVRVMKRDIVRETIVRKPERINVRLVADLSGSMDPKKRRVLEQCITLLLSSLREFNAELNLTRVQTKSPLTVDTQVWAFGSSAKVVKPLRGDMPSGDDQVEIVKVFEKLGQDLGTTADNKALSGIADSFSEEDKDRIRSGKIMELVFEITDGGADNPGASRSAADRLITDGVIARAFQIGKVDDEEKNRFNQVWNNDRTEPFGEAVGENIGNLTPAVVAVLKKFLSGVRL